MRRASSGQHESAEGAPDLPQMRAPADGADGGFLFNTDSIVGEAILKGRLLGKLTAERSLEIHSTAEIKGTFKTARLIIPSGNRFRWAEAIQLVDAEIGGELVARLQAQGTVRLKSTARFFGDVQAGSLVVEEGAVFVGAAKIGPSGSIPSNPVAI